MSDEIRPERWRIRELEFSYSIIGDNDLAVARDMSEAEAAFILRACQEYKALCKVADLACRVRGEGYPFNLLDKYLDELDEVRKGRK